MSWFTDLIQNGIKMFSKSFILICEVCIWTFQNISVIFLGVVVDCRTRLDWCLLYCKFGVDLNFKVDFHNELGHRHDTKWY